MKSLSLSLSSGGVCGALRQAEGLCVSQLAVIDSNGLWSSRSWGRWLDHRSLPCSEMRNLPLLQSLALSLFSPSKPPPLLSPEDIYVPGLLLFKASLPLATRLSSLPSNTKTGNELAADRS